MNKSETLEIQADRLAEEALHELGDTPFDDPDDYTRQCDYAGCYPWLTEVIHVHPHDNTMRPALLGNETLEEQDY